MMLGYSVPGAGASPEAPRAVGDAFLMLSDPVEE